MPQSNSHPWKPKRRKAGPAQAPLTDADLMVLVAKAESEGRVTICPAVKAEGSGKAWPLRPMPTV